MRQCPRDNLIHVAQKLALIHQRRFVVFATSQMYVVRVRCDSSPIQLTLKHTQAAQEVSSGRGGKSRALPCRYRRVSLSHAHVIDEEKETIGRRRRLSRVSSS
jgi:hypothetical protein